MKRTAYLEHIDTLVAAILGAIAVYMFTKYSGVGISPDSIMYASTATNLQAHGSLMTFNGTPLVFFPVFYPFFLAVVQFFSGVDPFAAGPAVNMGLFAAVIMTMGWLLQEQTKPPRIYKWLVLSAVVLSPALLEIYSFLWSETLFILEVVLFIWAFQRYQQKQTTGRLMMVALIAAISCITRYAGITLIGTGALIVLSDNRLSIRDKVKHIFMFGLGSVSLLVGNLILNSVNTGLSTGKRLPSVTSFTENLHYTGIVFCNWMGFNEGIASYAIATSAIILLSLLAVLTFKIVKGKQGIAEKLIIVFSLVYILFIILLATFSRFERLNSRLLSPVFIPLLISLTIWVPAAIKAIKSQVIKYALAGLAVSLMLLFNYAILKADLQRYDDEMDYGVPGYSDDSWNHSPFAAFLKSRKKLFKPGVTVYTNADEAVYLFTGQSSKLVPHRYFKDDVHKFYTVKHYYYIWFKPLDNVELINIKDIQKAHKLRRMHELPDGAIYEYDAKNDHQ
jgi:hypothetical protein